MKQEEPKNPCIAGIRRITLNPQIIQMQKIKSLAKLRAGNQDRQKKQMSSLDCPVRNPIEFEHKLTKETPRFNNTRRQARSSSSSLPRAAHGMSSVSQAIKHHLKLSTQRADQNNVLKKMRRSLSRRQPLLPENTPTNQQSVNLQYADHSKRQHDPGNDDLD